MFCVVIQFNFMLFTALSTIGWIASTISSGISAGSYSALEHQWYSFDANMQLALVALIMQVACTHFVRYLCKFFFIKTNYALVLCFAPLNRRKNSIRRWQLLVRALCEHSPLISLQRVSTNLKAKIIVKSKRYLVLDIGLSLQSENARLTMQLTHISVKLCVSASLKLQR